jgi:hypothetical protein
MKYFLSVFLLFLFIPTSVISQEKKHEFKSYALVGFDALAYQFFYRSDYGWEKYIDEVTYGGGLKYSYALLKRISPSIGFEVQSMDGKEENSNYKTNVDLYHLSMGIVFHLKKSSPFELDLEVDYLLTKASINQYYARKWEKDIQDGYGIGLGLNTRYMVNNFSGINFGIYTKGNVTNLENRGNSGYINQYAGLQVEVRIGYSLEF